MTTLPSIDLKLYEQLEDPEFRNAFFEAETSEMIARQLATCRKRRSLNQAQLAERAGTHQPLISRVEDASYRSWSFKTLKKLADALDARLRVFIEPWEDIRGEYLEQPVSGTLISEWDMLFDSAELNSPKEDVNAIDKYRAQQSGLPSAYGEATGATVSPSRSSSLSSALLFSGRSNKYGTAREQSGQIPSRSIQ